MSSSLKNIVVLLVILTFAFVGYYIFAQSGTGSLSLAENTFVTEEMKINTQLFMERSILLDKVRIDTSVLEDKKFITYRNFTKPVIEQTPGKTNPFSNITSSSNSSNF